MNRTFLTRSGMIIAAALAIAGCSGERGPSGANGTNGTNGSSCSAASNGDGTSTITCTDGTSATIANGTNGTNGTSCSVVDNGNGTRTITCAAGSVTVSDAIVDFAKMSVTEKAEANMAIVVTGFSVGADGKPVVTFKVSDRKGNGVKGLGITGAGVSYRVGLLTLATGVNGSANDTWVNYNADAANKTASAETAAAAGFVDNGDGTYSYTSSRVISGASALAATAYDPAAVHRVVIIMTISGNAFAPVNTVRDFAPNAFATDLTGQNEKVDPASCLECHTRFRANANGTGAAFHGGGRYDVRTCVACHNDQARFVAVPGTGSTPLANDASIAADGTWTGNLAIVNGESTFNLPVFIHKIHMGEDLTLKGGTYRAVPKPWEVTYPQDVRNCAKCHRNVAKASNWTDQPSRRACGACHDGKTFLTGTVNARTLHTGGAQATDSGCATCHGPTGSWPVATFHAPIAPPNPGNIFAVPTSTDPSAGRMNAAYVAAAGVTPAGAAIITYDLKAAGRDASKHPYITFRFIKDGTPVVFNTYTLGSVTEMMTAFVGSPSVYWAFAVPQDGQQTPADFNVSANAFIRAVWNKSNTNATMPDPVSGYYTITLTNVVVPDNATMLTGGIGYSYSLSNRDVDLKRNMPLTQTDLAAFPLDPTTWNGGLIVPVADVAKAATADTNTPAAMVVARRAIVDTAKCNACHGFLGVSPTFHIGQRNDAPTCSFCHTPNQTSSGWSAGSKVFIHGIHGASKRTVPFRWHAPSAASGYYDVTYPGLLNNCESCHKSGTSPTYDYSSSAAQLALSFSTPTTVGQARYNSSATTNPAGFFSISPYVTSDNTVDYGYGFATSNVTVTLPDGLSGTQGANACSVASPCTCTAANPCTVTVGTTYTSYNISSSVVKSDATGTPTCTDASTCTCTTNPASGPKTSCTATFATCTPSAPCNAQGTTLVTSPTVTVCSACHDSPAAINHMENDGFGSFYQPRSAALAKTEYCLDCHGPGSIISIKAVHSQP